MSIPGQLGCRGKGFQGNRQRIEKSLSTLFSPVWPAWMAGGDTRAMKSPPASPHTCPVITSAPSSPLRGLPDSSSPRRCPAVPCHPASQQSIAPKSPACLLAALLSKCQLAPLGPLSRLFMDTTFLVHGLLHPAAVGPLAFSPFLLSPFLLLHAFVCWVCPAGKHSSQGLSESSS